MGNALRITRDRSITRERVLSMSPVTVPQDPGAQFPTSVQALYKTSDLVYMTLAERIGRGDRTRPSRYQYVRTGEQWPQAWSPDKVDRYCDGPGAFMGLNPVLDQHPSGFTFGDVDVARFDYVLVESDVLPMDVQCTLLACLAIPIVALIDSGGKSIHGIVRVGGRDAADYKEKVAKLFNNLVKVGADPNTKNPGRLTRLPGAIRETEKSGRRRQELLYLNPEADGTPIIKL